MQTPAPRQAVAAPRTAAPCSAVTVPDDVAEELGIRAREVWVVRPDAHVAAVVAADGVTGILHAVLG